MQICLFPVTVASVYRCADAIATGFALSGSIRNEEITVEIRFR